LKKLTVKPKVVVGTLTWNQKNDVLECLSSLTRLDYPNFEIVVVDNASTDGTSEAIREQYPSVHIVRHTQNLGCAEGVNGEIRSAIQKQADYLFIIANDAVVAPSTLSELVTVAEKDSTIGFAVPKVYYYGSERRIWFARGIKIRDIDWLRGRFKGYIQNVEDDGTFEEEEEVCLYPGGFCLVRMDVIRKVGFLDPRYFIYFDDSEWLMRIYKAGYKGRYAPRAVTWHKPSSSVTMESMSFYYYRARNQLYFYKKYAPGYIFPMFFLYFLYDNFFHRFLRLYRSHQHSQMWGLFLGLLDFLRGKQGSRSFSTAQKRSLTLRLHRLLMPFHTVWLQIVYRCKLLLGMKVKIQIHGKWNIGDEIIMLPLYELIKKQFPRSEINVEVNHPDLLKENPFVDSVNQGDAFRPDKILNLHRKTRGKLRLDHLSELTGLKYRNPPRIKVYEEEVKPVLSKWGLSLDHAFVAVSPSAHWISRQWSRASWISLIQYYQDTYQVQVLVLGKDEIPLPVGVDLIGKTTLREAVVILSQSRLFVGVDSGLVHLAVALVTPTVGLFGPLNPRYLFLDQSHFEPIWSPVECRGCWSDARMKHPDHCPKIVPDCLSSIPLEQVKQASDKLLKMKKADFMEMRH